MIEIDFCSLDPRNKAHLELLYLWCKEGWIKSVLGDYHTQKQALSRFFLGAMVLSDPVLEVIRRELRRVSPDVRIETDQIKQVLSTEVIKREVMEGEKAEEAGRKIARAASKALRARAAKDTTEVTPVVAVVPSNHIAPVGTHQPTISATPPA